MLSNRNARLNTAFAPKGPATSVPDTVGTGAADTNFDPFIGTGWGQMLDALGASQPGGVKGMGGRGIPGSPLPFDLPVSVRGLDDENTPGPNTPLPAKKTRGAVGGTL